MPNMLNHYSTKHTKRCQFKCDRCGALTGRFPANTAYDVDKGMDICRAAGWKIDDKETTCPSCKPEE